MHNDEGLEFLLFKTLSPQPFLGSLTANRVNNRESDHTKVPDSVTSVVKGEAEFRR
jgi:hypothetical protein